MGCSLSSQAGTKRSARRKSGKKDRRKKQQKTNARKVKKEDRAHDAQVGSRTNTARHGSDGDGFTNVVTNGLNSTTSSNSNSESPSRRVKASKAPTKGASASETTTANLTGNPLLPGSKDTTIAGSERGGDDQDTTSAILSVKREKKKTKLASAPQGGKSRDDVFGPTCVPKKRGQMSDAKGKLIRLWIDAGDHGGPSSGGALLDPQEIHAQIKREQHLEFDRQQQASGALSQSMTGTEQSMAGTTMTGTSAGWSNTVGATVGSTYEFGEKATTRVVAQMPGPRPSQPVQPSILHSSGKESSSHNPQHRSSTQISSLNAPGQDALFHLLNSQIGDDVVYVPPSSNDDDQSVRPVFRQTRDGGTAPMSGSRSGSTAISSDKGEAL